MRSGVPFYSLFSFVGPSSPNFPSSVMLRSLVMLPKLRVYRHRIDWVKIHTRVSK